MENEKDRVSNKEPDTETYLHTLYLSDFLREPVMLSAVKALELSSGSLGLDAGCGIGSHTMLLAEAVGPAGHVTGLDMTPEFIVHAMDTAKKAGMTEQVSFQAGDVKNLPFDDDTFDWVWSVDCIGFHAEEHQLLLKELARVVKPGGAVAIMVWSSQQLLPGYPLLEARLNMTSSGIAPFTGRMKPELHFLRALGWFRDAGLKETTARTFVGDVFAPLSENIRSALISLIGMRWGEPQSELTQEDWTEYQRICLPESPDFILNLPDYYAFFTYSMFHGRVAK